MKELRCDVCGFVGHEAAWNTGIAHKGKRCPECDSGRSEAYVVGDSL